MNLNNPKEIFEDYQDSDINRYSRLVEKPSSKKQLIDLILKQNPELEKLVLCPLIKIQIQNTEIGKRFIFDENDLSKLLQHFGKLEKIIVKEKGECYVLF